MVNFNSNVFLHRIDDDLDTIYHTLEKRVQVNRQAIESYSNRGCLLLLMIGIDGHFLKLIVASNSID